MGITIRILVKGASKKLTQLRYNYDFQDGETITAADFLKETVRITMDRYRKAPRDGRYENAVLPEDTSGSDSLAGLLEVLSKEEQHEKAKSGKIGFGIHYNTKRITLAQAQDNALQCFEDGIAALFVDGRRYEKLRDSFALHQDSEVIFVRLTFLAGRLW